MIWLAATSSGLCPTSLMLLQAYMLGKWRATVSPGSAKPLRRRIFETQQHLGAMKGSQLQGHFTIGAFALQRRLWVGPCCQLSGAASRARCISRDLSTMVLRSQ